MFVSIYQVSIYHPPLFIYYLQLRSFGGQLINKKSTKIIIEDSTSAEKGGVQNTKDPEFYLSQIPVSSKDFISAREKIANACYQAAIIYKYDLQKVSKSNEMLDKILKIIDVDTSFIPLTYYNLYINFKEQNLKKQAINMKEKLLVEYPNSVFSRIILNPNYLENQKDLNSVDDKEYEKFLSMIEKRKQI